MGPIDPDQQQVPSPSSLWRQGQTPHEPRNNLMDMGKNLGKGNSKRYTLSSDDCVCVFDSWWVVVCISYFILVRTGFSFTPEKWDHITVQVRDDLSWKQRRSVHSRSSAFFRAAKFFRVSPLCSSSWAARDLSSVCFASSCCVQRDAMIFSWSYCPSSVSSYVSSLQLLLSLLQSSHELTNIIFLLIQLSQTGCSGCLHLLQDGSCLMENGHV